MVIMILHLYWNGLLYLQTYNMWLYNLTFKNSQGEVISMEQFQKKTILIVNTATKCGLTPQFEELEKLYQRYKNKEFVIIWFPSNQFANQEPETNDNMVNACKINYGVTFLLSEKIDVNGKYTHPIFKYLKNHSNHFFRGKRIKWNFTKFLIAPDGKKITRYSPITKPTNIEKNIMQYINWWTKW